MDKFKIFIKILLAIVFGLFLSFILIQNHQGFRNIVEEQLKKIADKTFHYKADAEIQSFRIISPSMQFKSLSLNKKDSNNWKWHANDINIQYSWFELLINRKLQLSTNIEKLNVFSLISDGTPCIVDHLKELLLNSKFIIPINIKNFVIKECDLNFIDHSTGLKSNINIGIDLKELPNYLKSNLFFKDGFLSINQIKLLKKLSGTMHIEVSRKNFPTTVSANLVFQIPTIMPTDCFLSGKFYNNQGNFALRTLNDELIITPITIISKPSGIDFVAEGQMPASYLENLFLGAPALDLSGICQFSVYSRTTAHSAFHGHLMIKDLIINNLKIIVDEAKFFFKRKNQKCKYNFYLSTANKFELTGAIDWDEKLKKGTLNINNPEDIWILNNKIAKGDLKINMQFLQNSLSGNYNCNILISGKPTQIEGKIIANKKICRIIGSFGEINTEIILGLKPKPFLKKIVFQNPKNKFLELNISQANDKQEVCANLEFSEIKKLLPAQINNIFSGKGSLSINGELENKIFKGKVELKDGNIIILNAYNIIKNLQADIVINMQTRSLQLSNLSIQLDRGSLTVSNMIIRFDDRNKINFIYAPILFNNCFLYWNNVFGTISGKILISKIEDMGKVAGKIVLNNSKIRNNIFSSDFGKKTFTSQLDNWFVSIILKSKGPIKVKTPMLDCVAKLDLEINGSIVKPAIDGQISLTEGKIFFPYKPLNIINGNILFISDSGNSDLDPLIELSAKAKLRNYTVSMFATGSINHPYIRLDSVPDLTEEQIGCLLLAGSENASLNLIVPTLIMQNLKNIIFGSLQTQTKLNKYFQTILKPLKHIRFVPTFVDETGRGGLRGGIEIDVSDKLHALIQKNFSMPEDTRFEVDYQLTDDISLRAIKDERGDLGGEIEMRWKI